MSAALKSHHPSSAQRGRGRQGQRFQRFCMFQWRCTTYVLGVEVIGEAGVELVEGHLEGVAVVVAQHLTIVRVVV